MPNDLPGGAPSCTLCAGPSHGAVHVVSEPNGHGLLLHLTFSWVCDRCGHSFTDGRLEAMNGPRRGVLADPPRPETLA